MLLPSTVLGRYLHIFYTDQRWGGGRKDLITKYGKQNDYVHGDLWENNWKIRNM